MKPSIIKKTIILLGLLLAPVLASCGDSADDLEVKETFVLDDGQNVEVNTLFTEANLQKAFDNQGEWVRVSTVIYDGKGHTNSAYWARRELSPTWFNKFSPTTSFTSGLCSFLSGNFSYFHVEGKQIVVEQDPSLNQYYLEEMEPYNDDTHYDVKALDLTGNNRMMVIDKDATKYIPVLFELPAELDPASLRVRSVYALHAK